ncbi:MAG: LysE family translocator [Anaerolineae bacterium]|nr:LysE family translocator [Anaerolineae bacterium]
MELSIYLTFIAISIGFIAIPGPNVLVTLSTSLSEGRAKGLQTVFGIEAAMVLQLVTAIVGTTWFVYALAQGFFWLKWCGVAYLLYLGIKQLRAAVTQQPTPEKTTLVGSFGRGFFVSLTNPKTILFFGAFLPQFASAGSFFFTQLIILSVTFWLLSLAVNIGYTLLASRFAHILSSGRLAKIKHGASGVLYLGAGTLLASLKRA